MSDEGKQGRAFGPAAMEYVLKKQSSFKDLGVIVVVAIAVFLVSARFDLFNKIVDWLYHHDTWQFDELFTVGMYLVFANAVFAWRRYRELAEQTRQREKAEAEKARLTPRLESALADVSRLKKLLPMCSSCKRIRDDKGYWDQVEAYVENHFATRLDAGLCPDCAARIYRSTPTRET